MYLSSQSPALIDTTNLKIVRPLGLVYQINDHPAIFYFFLCLFFLKRFLRL